MSVRVRYLRAGQAKEGSIESLLIDSGRASTRMMKYLIAQTEILVRKGILDARDLEHLAQAYQVDVEVLSIEVDGIDKEGAIDITPAIEGKTRTGSSATTTKRKAHQRHDNRS